MSSEQGSGSNPSTSPEVEGTKTIPVRRRLQRAQRVLAPKLMEALRRSRISSEEAPASHISRRWRATTAQKVYSLKLYDALQRSRRSATVRDTADKVLATTARGVTRWSRAILVSRSGTSLRRRRNTKPAWALAAVRGSGGRRSRKVSAVGSRVRVLGGLVPGCRRTALPELLDETADYIEALEMQVRAMTALSKILSEFQPSTKLGSAL
ncbi:hypothetical protein ISN45_Aa03g006050 [Arabidopsis thaliana x Arabidopsis arenosa]|uniref:Uncharacterized protein n=1 Tax=Arabidopsis thaliana x Arabidopsis arenosa TaxID=1240361 RepID=A0A8T2AW20_9BRAS|nr:hypothetical protein ISN45_Aa03g006050 [Arabidopsis thaliana x Arabidopsis arenosa]